ncbi:MAG: mechanosensitive ion channel family protein [Alphaproteobacteria bacterium]
MQKQIESLTNLLDTLTQFAVTYGLQLLGALVVMAVGLKCASWVGDRARLAAEARKIDVTLARFLGNVVKILLVAVVIVITLGNFGVTITPLIALAGAGAFGATMAVQGTLSNYGAGLAIILSRPFVVGDTIAVANTSGVVEDITLAATTLTGEDGERITVPNKHIVGEVIVNSFARRVVESQIAIGAGQDLEKAIAAIGRAFSKFPETADGPPPQIGVHGFAHGGVIIGVRFWAPSRKYFQTRYAVNRAIIEALEEAGIRLLPPVTVVAEAPSQEIGR